MGIVKVANAARCLGSGEFFSTAPGSTDQYRLVYRKWLNDLVSERRRLAHRLRRLDKQMTDLQAIALAAIDNGDSIRRIETEHLCRATFRQQQSLNEELRVVEDILSRVKKRIDDPTS